MTATVRPSHSPTHSEHSLLKRLYRLTVAIALLAALAPPLGYYLVSFHSQENELFIKAKLYAAFITQVAVTNPGHWTQDARELIEQDLTHNENPEIRIIYDSDMQVIAATSNHLIWPVLERTMDITLPDGTLAGHMGIQRTLFPVLASSILIAIASISLGMAIFMVLYILPARALKRTLLDLHTEKTEAIDKEERLRIIIESAREGIITLDNSLHIESFNPAAEEIFGYPHTEIIGKTIDLIIQCPGAEFGVRQEASAYHRDGREFTIELTTSEAHLHGQGKLILIARDISERKKAEEELMLHRNHLQELINAQTSDLIIARDKAEDANRAKSDFLSTMSHEIRTPINAILGMTYLALKSKLTDKQKNYLDKAYQSGQHLLHIVNEILDFSKIEKGKLKIEYIDFRLDDLIKNVTNIIGDSAARKNLPLKINTDSVPAVLYGDPLRIGQVLINLASNAVKFTSTGEIHINIRVASDLGKELRLHFEVIDTGIGIPESEQRFLFQPFHQADSSVTRKFGGTGLGLAINKLLIKLMRGEIGVMSAPGQGSTFWFTITLGKGDEANLPPQKPPPSFVSNTILNGIRILLAEDNLFNQEIAIEILQNAGSVVCVASNGLEAIDMLNKEPFDLILMDVQMPEMDGLEAARIIRKTDFFKHIPIIALTANAYTEDRDACLAAGMDEFISKPVQPDQLAVIVAKLIAQDRITKGEHE